MTIENCHNVGDMTTANGASFGNGLFHRTDGKIFSNNNEKLFLFERRRKVTE